MTRDLNIKEFAERVERLCDFMISKMNNDGSKDLQVFQDLKEDAADIQTDRVRINEQTIEGLDDYMRGIPPKNRET